MHPDVSKYKTLCRFIIITLHRGNRNHRYRGFGIAVVSVVVAVVLVVVALAVMVVVQRMLCHCIYPAREYYFLDDTIYLYKKIIIKPCESSALLCTKQTVNIIIVIKAHLSYCCSVHCRRHRHPMTTRSYCVSPFSHARLLYLYLRRR